MHCLHCIFDFSRHTSIVQHLLQGTPGVFCHSCCLGQFVGCETSQHFGKCHTTILQKRIRRSTLISQPTHSRHHMQSHPITSEAIVHGSNEIVIVHTVLQLLHRQIIISSLHVNLSIYTFIYLFIYLSIYLSSIYLLSIELSIYLSFYLASYLSS